MSIVRAEAIRPDAIFGPHERPLAATVAHFRADTENLLEGIGAELGDLLVDMARNLAGDGSIERLAEELG